LSKSCNVAKSNRDLNRYASIVPFDYNRVKLNDEFDNDYINASYIKVSFYIFDFLACLTFRLSGKPAFARVHRRTRSDA
jgi:protein tyrosine phosphatase